MLPETPSTLKCEEKPKEKKSEKEEISSLFDDLIHFSPTFLSATGSPLVPRHP